MKIFCAIKGNSKENKKFYIYYSKFSPLQWRCPTILAQNQLTGFPSFTDPDEEDFIFFQDEP